MRGLRSVRLPGFTHSIRFRLTVLYSTLLFAVTAAVMGGTYLVIVARGEAEPVSKTTRAQVVKVQPDGTEQRVGEIDVVKVKQVEKAVNYETRQAVMQAAPAMLGGVFLASLGIGWVLSGRALRPVGAIARTANEIQGTDLSRRINLSGPRDELRYLADTIDSMLDRLNTAFQAQRQLIDDASHELRSPLAIIRANVDTVLAAPDAAEEDRARAVAVVDRATTRMTRLVEDLLATARRSAPALRDTDVDLAVVVAEAAEEFESLAATRGLRIDRRLTGGLSLIGDYDALRRAVGNLLSNAVRLAPVGTRITVGTGRHGSWQWAAVRDTGPGIAPDDQARVFDRFWRGVEGRRSRDRRTGLGLAIVRHIVESHGGQVRLISAPGVGSTFVLWLPAAAADPAATSPPDLDPLETPP